MDDERDIDDSTDAFPLWNDGDRKPGTGSDEQRSCLAAIGFYLKSRIDSKESKENRDAAYQILAAPHYPRAAVEQQFRACANQMGEDAFWHMVATLPGRDADFTDLDPNLVWQSQNNRKSMERSLAEWNARGGSDDLLHRTKSMYFLMLGQRHRDAMKDTNIPGLYRGCYTADADRTFGVITVILRNGCGTSCQDLLNCQWNLIYDDTGGVDDEADGIPLWNAGKPEPGKLISVLAAFGFHLQASTLATGAQDMRDAALAILKAGHPGDAAAAAAYDQCHTSTGDDAFWEMVVKIDNGKSPDFDQAKDYLNRMLTGNPKAIKAAETVLRSSDNTVLWRQQVALYRVLLPFRRLADKETSKLFRACYRVNASKLMQAITDITP